PLLVEAYVRREWGDSDEGWGLQAGVNTLPFSLEHTGPAWTPQYTLTPSALNSWMWEEVRLVGIESEWWRSMWRDVRFSLLGGLAFGTDQVGRLLADRGWVLSDYLGGVNAELPLTQSAGRISVFDERDDRPALYALLSVSGPRHIGTDILGY